MELPLPHSYEQRGDLPRTFSESSESLDGKGRPPFFLQTQKASSTAQEGAATHVVQNGKNGRNQTQTGDLWYARPIRGHFRID